MPARIAQYLKLPTPELYTGTNFIYDFSVFSFKKFNFHRSGHSLRRTSTTLFANTGATIEALKRHTGHKSSAVCETYIEESVAYKKKTSDAIVSSLNCTVTRSSTESTNAGSENAGSTKAGSANAGSANAGSANADPIHVNAMNSRQIYTDVTERQQEISDPTEVCSQSFMESMLQQEDANTSQVSSQTFVAGLEKRFGFYKCDNLTINFTPTFRRN